MRLGTWIAALGALSPIGCALLASGCGCGDVGPTPSQGYLIDVSAPGTTYYDGTLGEEPFSCEVTVAGDGVTWDWGCDGPAVVETAYPGTARIGFARNEALVIHTRADPGGTPLATEERGPAVASDEGCGS